MARASKSWSASVLALVVLLPSSERRGAKVCFVTLLLLAGALPLGAPETGAQTAETPVLEWSVTISPFGTYTRVEEPTLDVDDEGRALVGMELDKPSGRDDSRVVRFDRGGNLIAGATFACSAGPKPHLDECLFADASYDPAGRIVVGASIRDAGSGSGLDIRRVEIRDGDLRLVQSMDLVPLGVGRVRSISEIRTPEGFDLAVLDNVAGTDHLLRVDRNLVSPIYIVGLASVGFTTASEGDLGIALTPYNTGGIDTSGTTYRRVDLSTGAVLQTRNVQNIGCRTDKVFFRHVEQDNVFHLICSKTGSPRHLEIAEFDRGDLGTWARARFVPSKITASGQERSTHYGDGDLDGEDKILACGTYEINYGSGGWAARLDPARRSMDWNILLGGGGSVHCALDRHGGFYTLFETGSTLILRHYVGGGFVDPPPRQIPRPSLSLSASELIAQGYLSAQDEPACDPGTGGNTIGFTTCATGLDVSLVPSQSIEVGVDLGEHVAYRDFDVPRPIPLALSAQVEFRKLAPTNFDVAVVAVGDRAVGLVSVVYRSGQPQLCLRQSSSAPCGATLSAPGDAFGPGENTVRLTLSDAEYFASAGMLEGPALTVNAAAVALTAPPTFLLHGGTPPWDPSEECARPDAYGDRPESDSSRWRIELKQVLESEARQRIGQNPWSWMIGARAPARLGTLDPALVPHWSYCGKESIAIAASHFAERMTELRQDGYHGPVWVIAHSMGGLVARHYAEVQAHGASQVTRLVTMGTPHEGMCTALVPGIWAVGGTAARLAAGRWDLAHDYGAGNRAYFELKPGSVFLRELNAAGLSPVTRYLALAGEHPASVAAVCDAFNSRGDGVVPSVSARFDHRPPGARSFDVRTEYCTPHSRGMSGMSEAPYYEDPQSVNHILAWLFDPAMPITGPDRTLDDCSEFLRGSKKVKDKVVGLFDSGKDAAGDAVDWGVRTLQNLGSRRCCVRLGAFVADALAGTRDVEFSGTNATVWLQSIPSNVTLGLELVAPDGAIYTGASLPSWITREVVDVGGPLEDRWHLVQPPAGAWSIRVVGSSVAQEEVLFVLQVAEEGPRPLELTTDRSAYRAGDTAHITARIELSEGESVEEATLVLTTPTTERSMGMAASAADAYTVDLTLAEKGVHTAVARVKGTLPGGLPFDRRASLDLPVLVEVDWAASSVESSSSYAWRGDPLEASAVACSVGPDLALGGASVVLRQGGRVVAAPFAGLLEGATCAEVRASWDALAGGPDGVEAEVISTIGQLASDNDLAVVTLHVHAAPSTRASVNGTVGREGWIVTPAEVRLAPFDGSLPLWPIRVAQEPGELVLYEHPLLLADDGVHELVFRAEDPSTGDIEPLKWEVVRIDQTPPITALSFEGPVHVNPNGVHIGPASRVVVDASDATSGVAVTYAGEGNASALAGPISLSGASRLAVITTWSEDNAGNQEPAHDWLLAFDADAPRTTMKVSPAPVDGHVSVASEFITQARDPVVNGVASGVAATACRVTGPEGLAFEGDCRTPFGLVGDDGRYRIEFWSVDHVGNAEPPSFMEVWLDNTLPHVALLDPPAHGVASYEPEVVVPVDRDADGFSDASEVTAGSDPGLSLSTPISFQALDDPGFDRRPGEAAWVLEGDAGMSVAFVAENAPWGPVAPTRLPSLETGPGLGTEASPGMGFVGTGGSLTTLPRPPPPPPGRQALEVRGPAGVGSVVQRLAADAPPGAFQGVALDLLPDAEVASISVQVKLAMPDADAPTQWTATVAGPDLRRDAWQRIVLPASLFRNSDGDLLPYLAATRVDSFAISVSVDDRGELLAPLGPSHNVAHARLDNIMLFVGAANSGLVVATSGPQPGLPAPVVAEAEIPTVVVGPRLNVTARALDPSVSGAASGIGDAELLLDGLPTGGPPARAGDLLRWSLTFQALSSGPHALEVKVTDQLGHTSVETLPFLLIADEFGGGMAAMPIPG